MPIRPFLQHRPRLGERVYIDEGAHVIGQVALGDDVSVWPGTMIRGDVNTIVIGARTNVQDNSVLHVTHDGVYTPGGSPLVIGSDVTVGHGVILHACTIEDACLIGMGAVVLDQVVVGKHSLIGAGAVVSPGKVIEPGSLWVGNPARFIRKLTETEIESLYYSARNYVKLKDQYLDGSPG
jgi:carbonic anhydrase/acetyltransferase-like protein (isoleucine patch superfamily)